MLDASLDVRIDGDATVTFTVENVGTDVVDLQFRSGQVFDVAVYDDETEVWRWGAGRLFTQAIQSLTLAPGESLARDVTWTDPPAGRYEVEGTLEDEGRSASARTTVVV